MRTIPKAHVGEQLLTCSLHPLHPLVATRQLEATGVSTRCRAALLTAALALTLVAGGIVAGGGVPQAHIVATATATSHLVAAPLARMHPFPECPGGASPCP